MKKEINKGAIAIVLSIFIILILTSLVSAGWVGWLKKITGKAATEPFNVSVSISGGNSANITYVSPISPTNPSELDNQSIAFSINMYDPDGVADLNDTSVNATFLKTGESARSTGNAGTCTLVGDLDGYTANYSCTILMAYWDLNGTWSVTVQGKDIGDGSWVYNETETFTYNYYGGMQIAPTALTWASASPGGIDEQADNHPLVTNNTGNSDTTIKITSLGLTDVDADEYIYTENFTASAVSGTVCTDQALVNNTATAATSSNANRGDLSITGNNSGQEDIYFCIPNVPPISSQAYNSVLTGGWFVHIG